MNVLLSWQLLVVSEDAENWRGMKLGSWCFKPSQPQRNTSGLAGDEKGGVGPYKDRPVKIPGTWVS